MKRTSIANKLYSKPATQWCYTHGQDKTTCTECKVAASLPTPAEILDRVKAQDWGHEWVKNEEQSANNFTHWWDCKHCGITVLGQWNRNTPPEQSEPNPHDVRELHCTVRIAQAIQAMVAALGRRAYDIDDWERIDKVVEALEKEVWP